MDPQYRHFVYGPYIPGCACAGCRIRKTGNPASSAGDIVRLIGMFVDTMSGKTDRPPLPVKRAAGVNLPPPPTPLEQAGVHLVPHRIGHDGREKAIQVVEDAVTHGNITGVEGEARTAHLRAATTQDEAMTLIADLPVIDHRPWLRQMLDVHTASPPREFIPFYSLLMLSGLALCAVPPAISILDNWSMTTHGIWVAWVSVMLGGILTACSLIAMVAKGVSSEP